jgi:RHS repeat-associated protein
VVNTYCYSPEGLVGAQETIPNPFTYVGRFGVMAEGNGLYYMRARYYDPEVARFITKDPIGYTGDLNLYGYTGNNIINIIDPLGLLKVHIWKYRGKSEAWGHASITLEDGTHISWWPGGEGREGLLMFMNIYSASPNDPQNFARDVSLEGRPPDYEINIVGLDEKKILEWWQNFKGKNKWKTLSKNCSTVAADALKIGGGKDYASFWQSHNIVWTPNDVRILADVIKNNLHHGASGSW